MSIRIAQVVEATTGGVARHLIDLVTHLDPAEFTCLLYLSLERPESWREPLRALHRWGFVLREIPMERIPDSSAVHHLAGWARRDAVDIMHLHSAKAGYLGRQAARAEVVPAIYTPHAFPFQRTTDTLRPLYRIIERRMATQTAKIICVSEGERQEALQAGLPENKLVVIPNGLDFSKWKPIDPDRRKAARQTVGIGPDEIVIGALARLVPQKGIDVLVQAAEDVLPDFPRARILIWGDGPERKKLESMCRQLRLKNIRFMGATEDPAAAYAAMDIFCAPSRWEGCPYALLEAMACGVPVVASDISGHTDLITNEYNGALFESDLPGPLAGALRMLLADVDVRDAFSAAGLKNVAGYTVERMVEQMADIYRGVMNPAAAEA